MKRETWLGVLAACALAFSFPLAASAAGLPEPPPEPPSAWTFDGGLYAWALWVQGDITARGLDFNAYADPIDLIDALDGPIIMANFNAKRGPFSLYADVVYAEFALDDNFASEAQPIPALKLKGNGRIGTDYTFGVYQADGFYQIADFAGANGGKTTFEIGGGARYIQKKLNVTAAINSSAQTHLGSLLNVLQNRINRIANQAQRLAALAQLNALRQDLLSKRIVRAKDKGLQRRVARLAGRLNRVGNRGQKIAALQAFDRFRLALLNDALNLNSKDISGNFVSVDSGNMDWVDPVIAMRMTHSFGKGRSITAMGDFGGFNVHDGLSSQAMLTYDCDGTLFGFQSTTSIGYKALWLNFEESTSNGTHGVNVVLHGPIAELKLRW